MSSNTEMIDQLVSQEALKSLDSLQMKLISNYTEMEKTLAMVQKLNTAYDNLNKNTSNTSKFATEQEKAAQSANKVIQESIRLEQEKKKVVEDVMRSEIARTKSIQEQEQATKKLGRTTQQLLSAADRTAKGIDISAFITQNEKGMKNYSGAINEVNKQLGIIDGLQKSLNDKLKEGAISEDQHTTAISSLTQKQTEYEQSLISLKENYERTGEAQRNVFNPASQAFAELDPKLQEQTLRLVEMNVELNNVRTAQKELDKSYKDGNITTDQYIQKKAELNNLESSQAIAVSNLSKELQLNQKIANTTVGEYDNLSARYSLMKIQINALGEAEGESAKRKRELEKEAKALYERMNELQKATGKAQLQVGDYTMINKELEGSLSKLNPALGGFVQKLKGIGSAVVQFITTPIGLALAVIGSLVGTIGMFTKAQESNISTGRDFKSMMDGMNNTLDYAKTAFANIDFTNFLNGLQEAYRLGKEASTVLQELFELQNSFSLVGKQEKAEIEELKTQMRDVNLSSTERLALADEIVKRTNDLANKEKDIIKQEIEGYDMILKSQTNLSDAEKEYIIRNYNSNKEQINNAQKIIQLEKEKASYKMSANQTEIMMNAQMREAKDKEIEALKSSKSYSEEAYNAWKKYSMAGEDVIANYVKAEEKLLNINIQTTKELRMTERLRNQILKSESKAGSKNSVKEIKEFNKELQAQGELQTFNYLKSAEIQKQIANDVTVSYDERRDALRAYIDDEIAAIEVKRDREVKQEGLTVSQIQLIREKALYEIHKLDVKYKEESKNLDLQENKTYIKQINERISAKNEELEKGLQDELVAAANNYAKQIKQHANNEEQRAAITEDYEKQKLELVKKYNQEAFDYEIAQMEAMLTTTDFTEDQKLEIQKKINEQKKKHAKEMADFEIKKAEETADKELTIEEQLNKAMQTARAKSLQTIWSMALDLANTYYDAQISKIDELEEREREYYDEKLKMIEENLEAGLMSEEEAAARKRIIEETQLEREKELEKQRRELERKNAIWNKANSIVQTTIAGAQAVAVALTAGPIIGPILAGIVGAMAAAQIAMIAAQQIPAYKDGTKFHPGGWAVLGDGGRHEMAILPSGEIWKSPDKDTLVNLPRGTEVLPDYKKAMMEMGALPSVSYYDDNSGKIVYFNDEVLRSETKMSNKHLGSINRNIGAMRANSMYSSNISTSGARFKNNSFN